MKLKYLVVIACLAIPVCFPAAAQQSRASDAIASQIGQLVIANANCDERSNALQAQLTKTQARIKELEDKYEPKKPEQTK